MRRTSTRFVVSAVLLATWVQTLAMAAAPRAAKPIDDPSLDWDALSRQVVADLLERQMGMPAILRQVKSAKCQIDLTVTIPAMAPMNGKLTYSWEDADGDGKLSDGEINVESGDVSDPRMNRMMKDAENLLRSMAKSDLLDMSREATIRTRETADGYIVSVKPKSPDQIPSTLTVSRDYRVLRVQSKTKEGADTSTRLKHVEWRGKWLGTEAVIETSSAGAIAATSTIRLATQHDLTGDIPLPSRVTVNVAFQTANGGRLDAKQEYAMHDWKLVKRDTPLVAGKPAADESGLKLPDDPEVKRLIEKLTFMRVSGASKEEMKPIEDAITRRVIEINKKKMEDLAAQGSGKAAAAGPTGKTIEDAIVIKADDSRTGIGEEYKYLGSKFGRRGADWKLSKQTLVNKGEKQYDKMDVELSDGSVQTIYFDITSFFGKF